MGNRNRLVPFWFWPVNWGLEGKRKQEEEARYYYDGRDLDEKIIDIMYDTEESKATVGYKRAINQLKYKYKDITEDEYEKEICTLDNKPYFKLLSGDYSAEESGNGQFSFELDWNDIFVQNLRNNGWEGYTDDQVVDNWFTDACRQMNGEIPMNSFVQDGDTVNRRVRIDDTRTRVS